MKPIIALDFDGTLLNSSFRHQVVLFVAMNKILGNSQVLAFDELNDFVSYKANGFTGLDYLKHRGIDQAEQINKIWIDLIERDEYLLLDFLYSEAINNVQIMADLYDIYIVTARNNVSGCKEQIIRFGLENFVKDVIIVSKNEKITKFEKTQSLRFEFIIGDTEVDYRWALQSNTKYYMLNRGFRSLDYWSSLGVQSYSNLNEIINELKL